MSIYITGDTHIPHDISKLSTKNWPIQRKLSKDDYLIVCGDYTVKNIMPKPFILH